MKVAPSAQHRQEQRAGVSKPLLQQATWNGRDMEQPTEKLERAIRKELPEWVKDIHFGETLDSQGAPVLLTFLAVDRSSVEDASKLWQAREIVARVFREQEEHRWPHVRFEFAV